MTRQFSAVEINKFSAGLVTDASPLTTPDNSSFDEENMVLNIDGSRNRRLGLDYEANYNIVNTTVTTGASTKVAITTYLWKNAGGDPARSIQVVQAGNELKFFKLDGLSISSALLFTYNFPSVSVSVNFAYAVVDGILVVTNGNKEIYSFEFAAPSTVSVSSKRLLIRDFFGVEDIIAGTDYTRGSDIQTRPASLTQPHLYNLRNQSWGVPRIASNTETIDDPLFHFYVETGSTKMPSNSDTVNEALYPDSNDADNRTVDRFFAEDLVKNPLGTSRAAQGFFIIDALDRGSSRVTENTKNSDRYPEFDYFVASLPQDETPSGATTIGEFAGRVFYSGFPGTVVGGDSHSPKMSSYVLFTKVIDSSADINICYQEGDPTSKNAPEILDTDGGFIRVNEAYGIQKLINLGDSLMVVAANGIWRIVGGTDNGFTATNYIVEKVSDRGCNSPNSIAVLDNGFMFWGDDAIYHVTTDQYGGLVSNNISFGKIQRYYDTISLDAKRSAYGEYDSYERKIRWVHSNSNLSTDVSRELVLDIDLQGFYKNNVGKFNGSNFPRVASLYKSNSYRMTGLDNTTKELGYIVVMAVSPVLQYTFAKYSNRQFRDWYSINNVGIDAPAFVITNYISGGDFQRDKQVNYITIHLKRTESGVDAEFNPLTASSCLVQARWEWADNAVSGKWGRQFQAYRYGRAYIPFDVNDNYDTGFATIATRNKLRGNGKVLSLNFSTEPYKDLHLYGWSMLLSVAENV